MFIFEEDMESCAWSHLPLTSARYLIHDRDPLYRTEGFHKILKSSDVKPLRLPARKPDLNSYSERFVKTVKSECLDHLILSSVKQVEYALEQFSAYYHHERIHQSLDRIIEPKHAIEDTAEIVCIVSSRATALLRVGWYCGRSGGCY